MAKFQVTFVKRTFSDERVALEVEATDAAEAEKNAVKYIKKNAASLTWTPTCLTKRPRAQVEGIVELGAEATDAAPAVDEAPAADAAPAVEDAPAAE